MSAQHTPGPWEWAINDLGKRVAIITPDRGRLVVMELVRSGMQGAAPRFAVWDGMRDGKPRGRLGGILEDFDHLHPDALVMRASPDLFASLVEVNDLVRRISSDHPMAPEFYDWMMRAGAVLARARGES